MTEKTISGYLVVNWQQEDLKVRKTKPTDLSPYQIALETNLTIEVPDVDTPEIAERLVIPQPTVERVVQQQVTGEEPEEWQQTADEVLMQHLDEAKTVREEGDLEALLGKVMMQAEGVPDPEQVTSYLEERIAEDPLHA